MASIPSTFTIEIDGKPITRCSDDSKDKTHAKTGTEAAVFKLENNRLESDGWTLARSLAENRMLGPKRVMWYRPGSEVSVHDVTATKDGDSYQLKFPNVGLMTLEEDVFADLSEESTSTVVVKLQS